MKKTIISSLSFLLVLTSFGQTNGFFSFQWDVQFGEEATVSTVNVYASANKTVIHNTVPGYAEEKVIIDRSTTTALELFYDYEGEPEDQKYYALTKYEDGLSNSAVISDVLTGIIDGPSYDEDLTLLNEKKTIAGLPCQKFNIHLSDGFDVTGWIATGVHVKLDEEYKYYDTENGMVVEMEMKSGADRVMVTLVSYDAKFPATSPVFSMDIPAGYSDLDEYINTMDDYGDGEEYMEEEEE